MKIANPILPGFCPDPSLVRAGDDYYIATSTFEWFPGVCIHHSRDLANWEIAAYALTDESCLDLKGIDTSCGIWAPNLTYDNGTFYLVYTIVYTDRHRYKDTHNFLITAKDVRGPWSKPVPLNRRGFDPSLFHDVDGRKWLVNMRFDYRLDHKRFGGVEIQELDWKTGKLTGPISLIFQGSGKGTTEGPNIFYYNGWYYLVTAEGGTESRHCVTMCRSRSLTGPYEPSPYVPVLTSFEKDVRLKCAGHGQIIQGKDGRWYMAHLCSRSIDGCSIVGRETAIQTMELTEEGWFRLSANREAEPEDFFEIPDEVLPEIGGAAAQEEASRTERCVRTDFSRLQELPLEYMTLRQGAGSCGIRIADGRLRLRGGNSLASKYQQCLAARRHQHHAYDFTAKMWFAPKDYCHMAGLVCYYNYDNYYYLYISCDDSGKTYAMVLSSVNRELKESSHTPVVCGEQAVWLQARVRGREVSFWYSGDGSSFCQVGESLDMRNLSDERIEGNGFTGAMAGVCCQDLHGDGAEAAFEWLEYRPAVWEEI